MPTAELRAVDRKQATGSLPSLSGGGRALPFNKSITNVVVIIITGNDY